MTETAEIDAALARAREHVLACQLEDGSWSFPVFNDLRISAFYLNLIGNLGRAPEDADLAVERDMAAQQLPSGAWPAHPGGGGDVEVTAVCAIALQDAHTPEGRRAAQRAAPWLERQSVPEIDGFWIGFLAAAGHLEWARVPYLSPRMVSVSDWFRPNLYDIGVIRMAMVATAIIQYHHALHRTDRTRSGPVARPAWLRRWIDAARRRTGGTLARANRLWRRLDVRRGDAAPLRKAVAWLLARQEEDGTFFSSVHMTTICLLALHTADATAHAERIERGVRALRGWLRETPTGLRLGFCDSTIWDTILLAQVLPLLGCGPDHPALRSARRFLLSRQITEPGDYRRRARGAHVGGWGFQRVGRCFPDVDDTTLALTALLPLGGHSRNEIARLKDAVRWLVSMQGSNGGWASWDRNDRGWIRLLGGGRWFLVDEPCPVISARTAIILDRIGGGEFAGFDDIAPQAATAAARGFAFVDRQRRGRLWVCRWFTHFIYGTCYGVEALAHRGIRSDPRLDAALGWFAKIAQPDGGFGESAASLVQGEYRAGPATSFHTGAVLMAFTRAGAADHPVARQAARWLLSHQDADGGWRTDDLFAAGVPGVWYVNFSATPTFYAAKSLALYRQAGQRSGA